MTPKILYQFDILYNQVEEKEKGNFDCVLGIETTANIIVFAHVADSVFLYYCGV